MVLPTPHPGLVIGYSYLWYKDAQAGQEEGFKDRPCVIVLACQDEDGDMSVTVVPLTHSPPHNPECTLEIPLPTKERLGLDSDRSWVVVSEVNRFLWPGPDLRAVSRKHPDQYDYGVLPPRFFKQIKEKLLTLAKHRRVNPVARTD